MSLSVNAWSEKVSIPTYEIGEPEKLPMFLEHRVYQGSSGVVYPYPIIEKVSDVKIQKTWQACFLENDFIKIMILPELGGRVQMAYDKLKKRHFVYYNQVIKPALVGLTGPWISGGIEFNWPQHHRPSTFLPVDFSIEENPDGSKTVWCSEIERMFRTKGMAGFTLYPDKAYLEVKVKLYNRTCLPQTFLWWANPAVHVNEHYQSVFPPDVHAVFDHGKRDVSSFPISHGTYYKVDYSAGVDISWYKNIPVPTSFMAVPSRYDFVGGYENDTQGGLLHVANHHVSPGKKQWTWGNGDFGKAWDRNLTDEDGPYIELMCGVFTDNQPDFSWIMPYEEKSFEQYFMPYRDLGVVKNASKDAMVNLEFKDGTAYVRAFATGIFPEAMIRLEAAGEKLMEERFDFHPRHSFFKKIAIDPHIPQDQYRISVTDAQEKLLIAWQPEKTKDQPIPDPARPARLPEEIETNEQLFLTGQHLEQYRHASYLPSDYYQEALRRDPGDLRNNHAMGLYLLRKGKFEAAESHFRRAFQTQTQRNPNPYDGEPLYHLGIALRFQGKEDEAFDCLYKSIWNAGWKDRGYFQLAQICAAKRDWEHAFELVERALNSNGNHHQARHLKVALLRKKEATEPARELIEASLGLDRFNFGLYYEAYLITGDQQRLVKLKNLMQKNLHNYIEIALDYVWAGLLEEALAFLNLGISQQTSVSPMAIYVKGWIEAKQGRLEEAASTFNKAEHCLSDYCFPNRLEAVLALEKAIELNPKGAKAHYYLGNFWYANRQYQEALDHWESSLKLDASFAPSLRNLALAYFNKFGAPEKALAAMEQAFSLGPANARMLMELDLLYKKRARQPEERLALLEKYPEHIAERDDLYLERLSLYHLLGQFERAYTLLMDRKFHPWEGGEGKVSRQYVLSLVEIAQQNIQAGDFEAAIDKLKAATSYPHQLGEGKLAGAQENDIFYWLGCAYEGLEQAEEAVMAWEKASQGQQEPAAAWFYNDQQADMMFYQGLALRKLGRTQEAEAVFGKLVKFGQDHRSDTVRLDYFAVSLPDLLIWEEDPQKRNYLECTYLMGLGYLGWQDWQAAEKAFEEALQMDPAHMGVVVHQRLMGRMRDPR